LLRKTSKRPTGGVFAGVDGRGDCGTCLCFSSERSFRETNSSASRSAPQWSVPPSLVWCRYTEIGRLHRTQRSGTSNAADTRRPDTAIRRSHSDSAAQGWTASSGSRTRWRRWAPSSARCWRHRGLGRVFKPSVTQPASSIAADWLDDSWCRPSGSRRRGALSTCRIRHATQARLIQAVAHGARQYFHILRLG
jgi:hypothetical protein